MSALPDLFEGGILLFARLASVNLGGLGVSGVAGRSVLSSSFSGALSALVIPGDVSGGHTDRNQAASQPASEARLFMSAVPDLFGVADDVLRGTYLDLARRWRMMAHQAESLEQKKERQKKQADWL